MAATTEGALIDELAACETVIEHGLATFVEVGAALLRIRDGRLYNQQASGRTGLRYSTFEDYCREVWHFSKTHANRLIEAYGAVEDVTPIGVTPPRNEAQARELARLADPDERRAVWQEAAERSEHVTAAQLRRIVDVQLAPTPDAGNGYVPPTLPTSGPYSSPFLPSPPDNEAVAHRAAEWAMQHSPRLQTLHTQQEFRDSLSPAYKLLAVTPEPYLPALSESDIRAAQSLLVEVRKWCDRVDAVLNSSNLPGLRVLERSAP